MLATLHLHGDCPCCGYRNRGIRVGTARPGMRSFTMQAGSLAFTPWECRECGHPMGHGLYNHVALDPDSSTALTAWRQRQRAKRKQAVA